MRALAPLAPDHPLVTDETICPGCKKPLAAGDIPTLLIVGPGDDPEGRQRRDEGRAYNAIAIPVHWECSTQDPTS